MKKILFHLKLLLTLLTLVTLISLVTASAQVASQGGMSAPQQGAAQQDQDNDATRGELASFDRFMDSHPEIAEQLRKDPSLVKNEDFVRNHRDLQEYLQKHPGVSEEISENPARFMHQERRFDRAEDRRGNDTTRGELASFDRFMDSHREIAEQLRKDPSLVKNEDFVRNHRDLQEYLQQHPGVSEEISQNPDRFMHQEQRFDRAEDQRNNYRPDPDNDRRDSNRRDNDTTRGELSNFDQFMDRHPEIAEQLRKDPSLVKNEDFVRNHRDLQEYLQQHPGVSEEISGNPDHFMRQEQRFDRHEDMAGGESATFGQFLGSHSSIAQDLSRNPSLANDEEYQKNHPDFQQYLQTHPGAQTQLKQNPQVFVKSAQPLGTSPTTVPKTTVEPATKAPTIDPMPKQ